MLYSFFTNFKPSYRFLTLQDSHRTIFSEKWTATGIMDWYWTLYPNWLQCFDWAIHFTALLKEMISLVCWSWYLLLLFLTKCRNLSPQAKAHKARPSPLVDSEMARTEWNSLTVKRETTGGTDKMGLVIMPTTTLDPGEYCCFSSCAEIVFSCSCAEIAFSCNLVKL